MRVAIQEGSAVELEEFIAENRILPNQIIAITPDGEKGNHILWYINLK